MLRRHFITTSTAALAAAPAFAASTKHQETGTKNKSTLIGIQIAGHSLLDEGMERCRDRSCEKQPIIRRFNSCRHPLPDNDAADRRLPSICRLCRLRCSPWGFAASLNIQRLLLDGRDLIDEQ